MHVKQAPFEQAVVVDGGLGQLVRKLKKHRSVCGSLCCACHACSPLVTRSNEDVAAAARRLFSTWKQRHHKSSAPVPPARLTATPGLDNPPAPVSSNQPACATPTTVPAAPEHLGNEVTGGIGATCDEQNADAAPDALKPQVLACCRPDDPSRSFWVDWLEAQLSGKQV